MGGNTADKLASMPSIMKQRIRVWDLPVRIFHWILATCFATAWLTLDSRYLDIHVFAGYLLGGLILFRLIWGFIGSQYARFSSFCHGPDQVRNHLHGLIQHRPAHYVGHTPTGSWAIYLLLIVGASITVTGLLTLGGEERHGPLAGWLSFDQGDSAHSIHELLAWLMLGLASIHILGVLLESLLQRENLIAAMINGHKPDDGHSTSIQCHSGVGLLMLSAILIAGFSWFQGYLYATPDQPYRPFIGPQLADNALWREECGSCHLAYHPVLLPARSWQRIMFEQSSHFGEDLFLEQESINEIESFLTAHAAELALTEAAWKIDRSIPEDENPIRITETGYWLEKHQGLPKSIWQRPDIIGRNCSACHLDAGEGTFEDAAMRIPDE